jgi:hypothetical protein
VQATMSTGYHGGVFPMGFPLGFPSGSSIHWPSGQPFAVIFEFPANVSAWIMSQQAILTNLIPAMMDWTNDVDFRAPYWLDVPIERQQELGIVSTRLKATLDTKIRTSSKSKKRPCSHPNESVLLPSAHYPSSLSALSKNLPSLSPTSRSTIRPRSPAV